MTSPSWDDEAFLRRCGDLIEKNGVLINDIADACRVSRDYFLRKTDTRSTDIIVLIAHYLDVDPRWLAFGDPPKQTP